MVRRRVRFRWLFVIALILLCALEAHGLPLLEVHFVDDEL